MSVRPILFVYREIVPGDLRKLVAESNDSQTGGGARDLRFPAATFNPVMHRIFTVDGVGRGGRPIRTANVTYVDNEGNERETELHYWPPTPSRKTEGRIAQVHASPALGGETLATDKGRIFVVLTKYSDGGVRCDFAYEEELKDKHLWAPEASSQIFNCMAAAEVRKNRTVQGYYDFDEGTGYCHAD